MTPLLLLFAALQTADAKKPDPVPGTEVSTDKQPWETKAGQERTKLEMVDALIQSQNPERALALIRDMRDAGSIDVELDVLQGRALRRVGLLDDADDILRGAIHHHPRAASAHHELGLLLLERKQVEDALPELKTAIKQEPKNADYLNNYGFALLSAGRATDAVPPLKAALKIDSTRQRTRNNLGFALVAAGKDEEAFRLFRSSQTEADAYYNVAYGLELKGDLQAALDEYKSALTSNPQHRATLDALHRLNGLPDNPGLYEPTRSPNGPPTLDSIVPDAGLSPAPPGSIPPGPAIPAPVIPVPAASPENP
jgi:Flp pilus assembly protein TadD